MACAAVLSFKPAIAPFKAVVLPLDTRIERAKVAPIAAALTAAGLSNAIEDSSASIGKRYARADELGVPFAVTYDHDSDADGCVTLRERDSCAQVRLPIGQVAQTVKVLCDESQTWAQATATFRVVAAAVADGGAAAASGSAGAAGAGAAKAGGSVGVKLEGAGRTSGKFHRPADME